MDSSDQGSSDTEEMPKEEESDSDDDLEGSELPDSESESESDTTVRVSCSPDSCDKNATCNDSEGVVECTCNEGWIGNGKSCSDLNECLNSNENDCDTKATCANLENGEGYTCTCNEGCAGDGKICTDVDGCAGDPCFEGVICTDLPAPENGFQCGSCPVGFAGDGIDCSDIDECLTGAHNCTESVQKCHNVAGGYECNCSSDNGFYLQPDGECRKNPPGCADIIVFADENLENAVREALDNPPEELKWEDVNQLKELRATENNIGVLDGFQCMTSLTDLSLFKNNVTDISSLLYLEDIRYLNLGFNDISDISALSNLTKLLT